MMSALAKPLYSSGLSVDEFIEWENQQDTKHELLDGQIIAMTGGTVAHASLILQLGAALLNYLKGTPCRVFTSDLKVQIAENVFYPDVVVSCDRQENDGVLCHNPKLIIEVLSNSTSRKDRFKKRLAYQQIESLEEYVLVSQEIRHVEIYRRAEDWQAFIHISGTVELRSVDFSLDIDELYASID
jgi:Uma2 family endonuclease